MDVRAGVELFPDGFPPALACEKYRPRAGDTAPHRCSPVRSEPGGAAIRGDARLAWSLLADGRFRSLFATHPAVRRWLQVDIAEDPVVFAPTGSCCASRVSLPFPHARRCRQQYRAGPRTVLYLRADPGRPE